MSLQLPHSNASRKKRMFPKDVYFDKEFIYSPSITDIVAMPLRFFLLVLFNFFAAYCLYAQGINPVFNEYNFENGLSSSQVTSLVQDDDNFLWIGTADGLNRYDGHSFTQYFTSASANSIAGNYINALSVMPSHILAVGTGSGLSFFDTRKGLFKTFRIADTTALFFMRNNFIKLCTDKNGNLWAGTQTDLYIFNKQLQLIHTIPGNYTAADINKKLIQWVWSIVSLPDNKVEVYYSNGSQAYDIKNFQPSASSYISAFPATLVKQIASYDADGRILFTQPKKDSVYLFDAVQKKLSAYPLYKNAAASFAWFGKVFTADKNTMYVHLADTGFFQLKIDGKTSTLQHINNLPAVNDVCAFLSDKQHNVWIGTPDGLYEWTAYKNQFATTILSNNIKISAEVNSFLPQKNVLWITTYGNGLYKYNLDKNTIQHQDFHLPNTTSLSTLWNITEHSNDTLWIGTQQGLIWYSTIAKTYGSLQYNHPLLLDSFPITTQFTDSHGLLWMGVGVGHGLVCYNKNSNAFNVYNNHTMPAFPLRHPTAIAEDENNNLWMGTQRGGGLVQWNRKANKFSIITAKAGTLFSDDRINDLFSDRHGSIWIATDKTGLLQYDIQYNSFKNFRKQDGLSHENVLAIEGSLYPNLWITTSGGLNVFNTQKKTFTSFYKKDGLPSDGFTPGIMYDTARRKMYAGFVNGIVEFDAAHIFINYNKPGVIINKVTVNNKPLHEDIANKISLGYTQNNLVVDFTAVDLVNGDDLKFRYRLNNKDWLDAGSNRQIYFSNLAPAAYTLYIQVANKTGAWNEHSTTLHFSIAPPFWKTYWFYLCVVLLLMITIYVLYNFRIKQLQKVIAMRNRIAQDLHDDIGGTMTAMNLTSQLAMQNLDKPVVAKKMLNTISDDLKNIGETLDDIVWAVNPSNDSMQEIMARMRRYASRTWEEAGIDFTIEFDAYAENIKLNMEQRRDVYLVFKEAVNNVSKHAKCKQAKALLWLKNNVLFIEVKDDGKGFNVHFVTNRNGLKNMQSRVQKWKGECVIDSSFEKGTNVLLSFPITQKGD